MKCGLLMTALALAAFACGSERLVLTGSGDPGPNGLDDGGGPISEQPPASRGVVLVHAAAFPAFRLCFENYPDLKPQPDANIMPNANVVGVEVGSVIRIEPLARAPGRVFVIDRGQVEASPGEDEQSCRSLICDRDAGSLGDGCLRPGLDYDEIAPITTPLGTDRVELLAIAGCANGFVLDNLGVDPSACGEGWQLQRGNLSAKLVELSPRSASPDLGLPVQLVHLAPMLDPSVDRDSHLAITFGPLSAAGALEQTVAMDPPLFASADPQTLQIRRDESSFYGSNGFRIALTRVASTNATDAGADTAPSIVVDQSLAAVQDLSAPRDVPANYYRVASNYALLLLGDPTIQKTRTDGEPNAAYNARRGLHLLALPILDPNDLDAGSDGAADAGDGGRR